MDMLRFCSKGKQCGKECEFDEMEHFAVRKEEGIGVYFLFPLDGAVSMGRPCNVCGNLDMVRIKEGR